MTTAQIAEARARGVQPTCTGGFGYMRGPDDALVEYAGEGGTVLEDPSARRHARGDERGPSREALELVEVG